MVISLGLSGCLNTDKEVSNDQGKKVVVETPSDTTSEVKSTEKVSPEVTKISSELEALDNDEQALDKEIEDLENLDF